ncbi:MAG: methylmalonyl Co-A mutase-associated GTPase MeaB [bacterium]|nr:methylmalonyl Co-A mutase-associated GTPase MeaB [bacterium]
MVETVGNRAEPTEKDVEKWVNRVRLGDRRALARALTLVENAHPDGGDLVKAFRRGVEPAYRVGFTGAPGVGKSTLIAGLVTLLRTEDLTVAVLAIDPSSPITAGALLGDRIRLQNHVEDSGVYVRSAAGRGHLGGLSSAAPQMAEVLAGAGFDFLLIETVGVGQSEVEIRDQVDSTVVMLTPGWGDSIQMGKAGILEIGDIYVVNKADQAGSAQTRLDLERMIHMGPNRSWQPPVLETIALEEEGIEELWQAIGAHRRFLGGC